MSPALNHFPFAHPAPSLVVARIGGRRSLLLASAATQSTLDHQKTTHRGLGARHNRDGASRCDALFPADRQGRVTPVAAGRANPIHCLCLLHDVSSLKLGGGLGPRPFRQFAGIGSGCSRPLAIIQHRRKGVLKRSSERHPSHFKVSRLYAPNLDRGGHDEIHETPTFGATHDR